MTGRLRERRFNGSLAEQLAKPSGSAERLLWLGQAGFVVDIAGCRVVIDPYLSDSLAEKYRGTQYPHQRMMPPPIEPTGLIGVDYVLCTHAHTDHMDPGTLPGLFAANPSARLVAPRAVRSAALERSGLSEERILLVNAGETLDLAEGLRLVATRSAHETLEQDNSGNHRFLGFMLESPNVKIWHSGDTIPFDGLVEEVKAMQPDIALMPVNGRRPELSSRGVPGNLTLPEAVDLSSAIGAGTIVAHHYGLFDFNTIGPELIDSVARSTVFPRLLRAREAIALEWAAS
ncbi:putative L-ascorbate-6-phosphate lactonase UlaG [Ensifer psoraleae]|uniref:MBL fold metallo-hydrolase n=1 Tax=Sinorhizobium psoraleae TaxID=520838 RepID=UPI0015693867|nr:MBL fold metallo-hydrolase [Sinorhizobium psoraleae]NRP74634.1 putative L-ascorbate-6-phosphate lactonase UlaG [Sinorhizobium psoraleae]